MRAVGFIGDDVCGCFRKFVVDKLALQTNRSVLVSFSLFTSRQRLAACGGSSHKTWHHRPLASGIMPHQAMLWSHCACISAAGITDSS
jgi:hypothetical protein